MRTRWSDKGGEIASDQKRGERKGKGIVEQRDAPSSERRFSREVPWGQTESCLVPIFDLCSD